MVLKLFCASESPGKFIPSANLPHFRDLHLVILRWVKKYAF